MTEPYFPRDENIQNTILDIVQNQESTSTIEILEQLYLLGKTQSELKLPLIELQQTLNSMVNGGLLEMHLGSFVIRSGEDSFDIENIEYTTQIHCFKRIACSDDLDKLGRFNTMARFGSVGNLR